MLKPRYILIIIIGVFVLITVSGFLFENILLARSAAEAYSMVEIAATAALKSCTMSDEFFSDPSGSTGTYSGGLSSLNFGGITNVAAESLTNKLYLAETTNPGASFSRNNGSVFEYALNMKNASTEDLFVAMYTTDTFKTWASNVAKAESGVTESGVGRSIYWTDTLLHGSGDNVMAYAVSGTTNVPKLYTMGVRLFLENDFGGTLTTDAIYKELKDNGECTEAGGYPGSVSGAMIRGSSTKSIYHDLVVHGLPGDGDEYKKAAIASLLGSDETKYPTDPDVAAIAGADYYEYVRETTVGRGDNITSTYGSIDYFYTPTSLGLTYLDPDVLDTLFRTNMDLLMRASFIESDGSLSSDYSAWVDSSSYMTNDQATGATPAWANYICNNGDMYYARGIYNKALHQWETNTGTALQEPKIEYVYFNLGDDTVADSPELNQILSRAVDPMSSLARLKGESTNSEPYELVVAKVTFYADFILPYKTAPVRGMARNFGTAGTGLNETTATFSEAGFRSLELSPDLLNDVKDIYLANKDVGLLDDFFSDPLETDASVLENSTTIAYTTYYAIVN